MNTILLDTSTWDLTLDRGGNIALATGAYALAQDVASACRLFRGELWYDRAQGVPYFQSVLGQPLSPAFLKAKLSGEARRVPGVVAARVTLDPLTRTRDLTGKIEISDDSGRRATITGLGASVPLFIEV